MGANATQAQAVVLFILAFTMISAGLAVGKNFLLVGLGILLLGGSIGGIVARLARWPFDEPSDRSSDPVNSLAR